MKGRPGGTVLEYGSTFNDSGLSTSGLSLASKLIYALEINNKESGFMGFSGKFTISNFIGKTLCYGEHDALNRLHGRGI